MKKIPNGNFRLFIMKNNGQRTLPHACPPNLDMAFLTFERSIGGLLNAI